VSLDLWLAFAAASAILLAVPGPTILLVISYALSHGRRAALSTVAGVGLGDFTAMTASLLGLGLVLATSALLFTVLKWLGAVYLIWLGVKMWRRPVAAHDDQAEPVAGFESGRVFRQTFLVTALNPKSLTFFVAFLPQFLDASRALLPQMALMEVTFLTLAVLNAAAYAMLASSARSAVRHTNVQRTINRLGGSLLVGAGLLTASLRRTI